MGLFERVKASPSTPASKPADPQAIIEAARDVFESANGQVPPQILPALLAGGREILRQPPPWHRTDREIIRYLDTAYGGRQHWLAPSTSWEDRVDATADDRATIAELEAAIIPKQETAQIRRMEYVNLERESRRRQVLLGRAHHDDHGRLILPKGEDLSASAFERLDVEQKRSEKKYVEALEQYEEAKGALCEYKQRVQERFFHGELVRSQLAARAEQEARGVRWDY